MMILHCLWILKHPLQFHLNSFSSNSVERYTPFYLVGFNDEILEAAKNTCKTHFIWRGSCLVNKDCIHRNPIRRSWCCAIWREDNRLYICEWSVRWVERTDWGMRILMELQKSSVVEATNLEQMQKLCMLSWGSKRERSLLSGTSGFKPWIYSFH